MVIKGVLFDFDGTLTLPGALDFPAIKKALGCPLDQLILEFVESQPPDRQAGLMEILEEREDSAAQASLPNRGAEKCLRSLRKRQIPVGILTRNRLKSVKKEQALSSSPMGANRSWPQTTLNPITPSVTLKISRRSCHN